MLFFFTLFFCKHSEVQLSRIKQRTTMTYYDIGETLKISPSTAFRTVQRVHARVKEICIKLSHQQHVIIIMRKKQYKLHIFI